MFNFITYRNISKGKISDKFRRDLKS